jgi:hypothetical protein
MKDVSARELRRIDGGVSNFVWMLIGYVFGEVMQGIYDYQKGG